MDESVTRDPEWMIVRSNDGGGEGRADENQKITGNISRVC